MNILTSGLRHLRRRTLFVGINTAGLGVGIGAFLLIGLFLRHELTHDSHLPGRERIFRVVMENPAAADGTERRVILPERIGPDLGDWFVEVEEAVRVSGSSFSAHLEAGGRHAIAPNMLSADASFFQLFEMPSISGDARRGLESPGSIVLTASLARALFAEEDAVGQVVAISGSPESAMLVTAVVVDPPPATHLPFDAVIYRESREDARWNYYSVRTYVRLAAGADHDAIEASMPRFVRQHFTLDYPYEDDEADRHRLWLQPLTDIHLAGDITATTTSTSPLGYVHVFALVALLMLGIACVNYVNLATAYAAERGREVGIRRTIGATQGQLRLQFAAEAVLVSLLALPVAWLLMSLALPRFTMISGIPFGQSNLLSLDFLGVGFGVACIVGLLGGLYPAISLSRFTPQRNRSEARSRRGSSARLRQGLVVFQFAASAALIICALTISRQMDLIREARMGGIDEQVVILPAGGTPGEKEALKKAIVAGPDILAASYGPVPNTTSGSSAWFDEETQTRIALRDLSVGEDYLETLGLELAEGEALTRETVVPQGRAVLLNESGMRVMGATVGTYHRRFDMTPVGVIRDYHFEPLFEPISALRIVLVPENWNPLLVRLQAGRIGDGLEHLRRVWAELRPDHFFEYRFLDQELDKNYHAEIRMGVLFRTMTLVTLFIATLGLFGLAAFSVQQRTKEIGIRKVLGASVTSIISLLSRRFILLVVLSVAIAALPAYLVMQRWLEDFAYRTDIGPGIYMLTAGIAVGVALVTVIYHAVRAASANPVEALRSE